MRLQCLRRDSDSGIFQVRKRVPEWLRPIVGKREIKLSLCTTNRRLAEIRCLEVLARIAREWSGIDGAIGDVATAAATLESQTFYAENLDTDTVDATIVDGTGRALARVQRKGAGGSPLGAAGDAAPGRAAIAKRPTSGTTNTGPTATPPVTAEGASNETAATKPPPTSSVPLRPLFEAYAAEAELAPSTVKRWSPVVDRLIGHLGHDDAAAVRRADIVAWKDSLLAGGIKNVTVRDVYLASTKAMFQFAVDQGGIAENPAGEVKLRVKKKVKEREKGFDAEEAYTILAATLRKFDGKISTEMKAARRWVPWICAYTGARVNEITPLKARDFVKRDGIWLIRIRGANAKSRSYRDVPLHSHLIETGLLDYAQSRGSKPLFYDPGRSRGGKDSSPHHKKVGERLAEWVRSLGIDMGVAPNHGWRHRFSSVGRFVGMPEDVRNIIQGHAGTKVADDYGDTWPLVALREIEKLPRYAV